MLQPCLAAQAAARRTTRMSQVCCVRLWLVASSEAAVRHLSSPPLSLSLLLCCCACSYGVSCAPRKIIPGHLGLWQCSKMITMPDFGLEGASSILAEILSIFVYLLFYLSVRGEGDCCTTPRHAEIARPGHERVNAHSRWDDRWVKHDQPLGQVHLDTRPARAMSAPPPPPPLSTGPPLTPLSFLLPHPGRRPVYHSSSVPT